MAQQKNKPPWSKTKGACAVSRTVANRGQKARQPALHPQYTTLTPTSQYPVDIFRIVNHLGPPHIFRAPDAQRAEKSRTQAQTSSALPGAPSGGGRAGGGRGEPYKLPPLHCTLSGCAAGTAARQAEGPPTPKGRRPSPARASGPQNGGGADQCSVVWVGGVRWDKAHALYSGEFVLQIRLRPCAAVRVGAYLILGHYYVTVPIGL